MLPGIVSPLPAARCGPPATRRRLPRDRCRSDFAAVEVPRQPPPCCGLAVEVPRQRAAGSGETIPGNNYFHVVVQSGLQSQSHIPFPQFLLLHGRDNPTPLRVWLWKYQRLQRTRRIIEYSPNSSLLVLWCGRSVLFAMTTAERYPNNYNLSLTHTHSYCSFYT